MEKSAAITTGALEPTSVLLMNSLAALKTDTSTFLMSLEPMTINTAAQLDQTSTHMELLAKVKLDVAHSMP